jgi:hypothetical protein
LLTLATRFGGQGLRAVCASLGWPQHCSSSLRRAAAC